MLDAFASVGVQKFDIEQIDINQEHRGFRRAYSIEQTREIMPPLLDYAARRKNNVIIRPYNDATILIQLDDLCAPAAYDFRDLAFLTVATSPGNHQVWLACPPQANPQDLRRRIKKAAKADANASGTVRIAGSTNFKRKYEPDFPTVSIKEAHPGRIVKPEQLQALGLIAPPDPPRPPPVFSTNSYQPHRWPSYQKCLDRAPTNHAGDAPDVSRADFVFALIASNWGHSPDQIADRLMECSRKAQENGQRYAALTARNAAAIVAARPPRDKNPRNS